MPIIKVEMWEGRTLEQKRELVEVLTKETARIAGCSIEFICSLRTFRLRCTRTTTTTEVNL